MKKQILLLFCALAFQCTFAQHLEFGGGAYFVKNELVSSQPSITTSGTYAWASNIKPQYRSTKIQLSLAYNFKLLKKNDWFYGLLVGGNFSTGSTSDFEKRSLGVPILLNVAKSLGAKTKAGFGLGVIPSRVRILSNAEYSQISTAAFLDFSYGKNIFRISGGLFPTKTKFPNIINFTRKFFAINYLVKI